MVDFFEAFVRLILLNLEFSEAEWESKRLFSLYLLFVPLLVLTIVDVLSEEEVMVE